MDLSIIVPTYNEGANVRKLTEKITRTLHGQLAAYEILFVDDSTDDTPRQLERLADEYPQVRYIHRIAERGLASAVVLGFRRSRGDIIIVMDADLQHPPELLPVIVKRLAAADIVIPSRFISGGSDGGLSRLRKLVSWTARSIGRLFIRRLRVISDCTGGYFGVHRRVLAGADLQPVGWKILMEVLVKGNYHSVHEIPYPFAPRDAGASKMTWRDQRDYLRHVVRLSRHNPEDSRFFAFCLVGAAGVVVNLLCLKLFLDLFGLNVAAASTMASLTAMIHNYLWNDNVTWRQRKTHPSRHWFRFTQFAIVSALGIGITAILAHTFHINSWNPFWGQLAGITLATWWNFVANDRWTWGRETGPEPVVTRECAGDTP